MQVFDKETIKEKKKKIKVYLYKRLQNQKESVQHFQQYYTIVFFLTSVKIVIFLL